MSTDEETETEEKTPEELAEDISRETKKHIGDLKKSEKKDIVVVLGNTGSGKSTTLNWLAGKELIVGSSDDIVLKNKSDTSAMAIGETCGSMTRYPASIMIDDTLFFDLPGIRDTGGISCDLMNAAFIKSILEKASSIKVMFFVSEGDVKGTKAELFKVLLDGAKEMFYKDKKILTDSSLLIFTKRTLSDDIDLGDYLINSVPKSYRGMLRNWIDNERLFQVKSPKNKQICMDGRREILSALNKLSGQKISGINIDALYPSHVDTKLKDIFRAIFNKELSKFMPKPDEDKLSSLEEAIKFVRGDSRTDDDYRDFWGRFSTHLESVDAVGVLKPLSERIYKEALEIFQEINSSVIKSNVSKWDASLNSLFMEIEDKRISRIMCIVGIIDRISQIGFKVFQMNDKNS